MSGANGTPEKPCSMRELDLVTAPVVDGSEPIVHFDGVTKTYGAGTPREFTAIRDVSFTVQDLHGRGEMVGILGPSGCGKSTILRIIAGLAPQFPQTRGIVKVKGGDISGPGSDRGMVFQDYTSFSNRSVLDNVAFGLECRGVDREERHALAREWIGKVGLNPDKDAGKYPHQLSGGMKQRVAIARTLILKPRIILMDEPFGALDPVTREHMQDLLVGLWRELEATVFFVTHDVREAVYLGDRIFVLSNSPGTILHQIKVAPPDRPSKVMQQEHAFQESVLYITNLLDDLEEGKD
ncbi:MAG: ABC transporter ATP-binding protein [Kiritimatiellia bacterium]